MKGGTVMAGEKTLAELIAAADGSAYRAAMDSAPEEAARFRSAINDEVSDEEYYAAWRDYSRLAARAFRLGRLWSPEIVGLLAPLLLVVNADIDEIERIEAACEAMPQTEDDAETDRIVKQIKSPLSGRATLRACVGIAKAFEVESNETRIRGGYLTEDAQPFPVAESGARSD